MKTFNQAPLPFMGQKRKFLKQFKDKLQSLPQNGVYVDLFGGSGLLSRTVKDTFPEARVIYNDFDNYRQRIEHMPQTNKLLSNIRIVVSDAPRDKRLSDTIKASILQLVEQEKGFVDYVTLSANLLFSMKYVNNFEELRKETFYNVIRQSDYSATDYLDVLNILQFSTYFYFTSNKSQILELCTWMSNNSNYQNPFDSAHIGTTQNQVNYSSIYTDIMVFKQQ